MVFGLAGAIIIARVLGPEGRGALSVIETYMAFLLMFGSQWLYNSNIYYIALDNNDLNYQINNNISISLVSSIITIILFLLLYKILGGVLLAKTDSNLLILLLLNIPFSFISNAMIGTLLGLKRYFAYNLMTFLQSLILTFSLFIVLVLFHKGLFDALLINIILSIIQTLFLVIYFKISDSFYFKFEINNYKLKESFIYGIKMLTAGIAGLIIIRSSIILIDNFKGNYDTGIYSIALRIIDLLFIIPNILNNILFPEVTPLKSNGEKNKVILRWVFILVIIQIISIIFLFFWGKYFIIIMFGERFINSYNSMLILLPGAFLLSIEMVMIVGLSSIGLPRSVPIIWSIIATVSIISNLIIIPSLGYIGAAIVTTSCYGIISLGIFFLYKKHLDLSMKEFFNNIKSEISIYHSTILTIKSKFI